MGTGALDIDEVARRRAEKAFANMAAAGVAGAKDQDGRFHKTGKH
jgi:hypothetical protein